MCYYVANYYRPNFYCLVWESNDTDENPSGGTEVTDEFVLVYESQELKEAIPHNG